MPQLKNPKHELLAHELVAAMRTGATNGEAYTRSGYSTKGRSAEACVSRLLSDANNGIARRVQELVGRGAKRAEVTVEALLNKLEDNIVAADAKGQHGAVNGAVRIMAELRGMLVNKTEIGGVGEFAEYAGLDSDAVLERWLATREDLHGELAVLDMFRAGLIERIAREAKPVQAPRRRVDEASAELVKTLR